MKILINDLDDLFSITEISFNHDGDQIIEELIDKSCDLGIFLKSAYNRGNGKNMLFWRTYAPKIYLFLAQTLNRSGHV